MKELLIKIQEPWGVMRLVRLALSVVIGLEAYHSHAAWMYLPAIFFFYQALANISCSTCPAPSPTKLDAEELADLEVIYEEVK